MFRSHVRPVRVILSTGVAAALLAALWMVPGLVPAASAATIPTGFVQGTVSGLGAPTSLAVANDGRVFVASQTGDVRIIQNGAVLSPVFLHVDVNSDGERGLIGITLDPQFPTVPRVYIQYTVPGSPPHNRVSWFQANGNVATGSEHVLTDMPGLSASNHNGGGIHFGPDGQLYIAVGENNVRARAQDVTNPFGKILRIDPGTGAPSAGNPFADGNGPNDDRIYAFGLRNPFTFGFQPGNGFLFINDVGESTWEEIDLGAPGANYGWPQTEGPTSASGITSPLYAYTHSGSPGGCALIVGAAFYNPAANSFGADFLGDYFFADLCGGWIMRRDTVTGAVSPFATGFSQIVDLAVTPVGQLVVADHGGTVTFISGPPPRTEFLRNTPASGVADTTISFGLTTDTLLFCDWDGNGTDTPGVWRNGTFFLRNSNTSGGGDVTINYGLGSDVPVCGDWNGDGTDTIGVFRNGTWFLRNANSSGVADVSFSYGLGGDVPVTGSWTGAAADGIGVYRNATFYLRNSLSTGVANTTAGFGVGGDRPVVGDWDGNNSDTLGVRRGGTFLLSNSNTTGVANITANYGLASDQAFKGNFDGSGGDGIGVSR